MDDCRLFTKSARSFSRSVCVDEVVDDVVLVDEVVDDVVLVDDESSDGGGPGGGPWGRCAEAAEAESVLSVPFCENELSNTDFSSLACDEVSEPDETCESIRLDIFDFISDGLGGVDELDCDVWSDLSDESIESSAVESALSSEEEIVPADTSDLSSF